MAPVSSSQSRLLLLLAETLLLAGSGTAAAQSVTNEAQADAAEAAAPDGDDEDSPALDDEGVLAALPGEMLLLRLWLNGEDRGVIELRRDGERFLTSRAVLRRAGLDLPGDDPVVELDGLPGAELRYDADLQTLELVLPLELLGAGTTRLNQVEDQYAPVDNAPGALLNYDVYGGLDRESENLSGLLEFRAFGGSDVFDTTVLMEWHSGGGGGEANGSVVRLDSGWSRAWPERRLRLLIGDTVTSVTSWSRPTRIGGIQLGTDFSLQPYMPTVPIPAFFGSAVLPSQIELYINGVRTWTGGVPAGPYELSTGPTRIDGAGQAQVVLTDALGRVTTQAYPIYDSPDLLRAGLSEWSAEAGVVRLDYGIESFSYADEPTFNGSFRRGITDWFTLEAHAEATPHLAQGGLGAAVLLGQFGVVTGSFAVSQSNAGTGTQWTAGYSWSNGAVYVGGEVERASPDFADIATQWDGPPLRARDQFQAGISSRWLGAVGVNYIRYEPAIGPRFRSAGLTWSRSLGERFSVYASAEQNLDDRDERRFMISLSFTPGKGYYGNAGWQNDSGRDSVNLTAQQTAPLSGGVGWHLGVNKDIDTDRVQGQAEISWLGPSGEARAGVAKFSGHESAFAGYSGSLVLIGGGLYASRRVDDGFALVSTGGLPEVPITVENNVVGSTNRHGRLLVTRLNAYERNAIGIDPSNLPLEVMVDATTVQAVPGRRAGVIVEFPLRELTAVVLTVTDAAGTPLATGSTVSVEGSTEQLVVGFEGQLYVENPPPGGTLTIEAEGTACTVQLPAQIAPGGVARLGALRCEAGR